MYSMDKRAIEHKLRKYKMKMGGTEMERENAKRIYASKVKKYEGMLNMSVQRGGTNDDNKGPLTRRSEEILKNVNMLYDMLMPSGDRAEGLFEGKLNAKVNELKFTIDDISRNFMEKMNRYEKNSMKSAENVTIGKEKMEKAIGGIGSILDIANELKAFDLAYAYYGVMKHMNRINDEMEAWLKGNDTSDPNVLGEYYTECLGRFRVVVREDTDEPCLVPKVLHGADDVVIEKLDDNDLAKICEFAWKILQLTGKIRMRFGKKGDDYIFELSPGGNNEQYVFDFKNNREVEKLQNGDDVAWVAEEGNISYNDTYVTPR